MPTPRKSLGRGLNTLISGSLKSSIAPARTPGGASSQAPEPAKPAPVSSPPSPSAGANSPAQFWQEIAVGKIVPARWQARREFDEQALTELAESIRAEGLLQPVVVRQIENGYELIAGERRWRAFKKLALKTIPARIVTASDASTAVMTLIENLQREGLNVIEEAVGFASLMRDFSLTQEAVAERVGKPRATIANSVRLLSLDREIQGFLSKGMLGAGHAKVILGLQDPAERSLVARRVVESGASVREAETFVKNLKNAKPVSRVTTTNINTAEVTAAVADIEKRLTTRLNTKVRVKHGAKQGRIVIEYYGNDDLRRILEKIGGGA